MGPCLAQAAEQRADPAQRAPIDSRRSRDLFTQFAAPERAPHPQHGQPGDARGAYLALPFGTFSGVGAGRQNNKPKPGARLGQTSRWMGAAVMAERYKRPAAIPAADVVDAAEPAPAADTRETPSTP